MHIYISHNYVIYMLHHMQLYMLYNYMIHDVRYIRQQNWQQNPEGSDFVDSLNEYPIT